MQVCLQNGFCHVMSGTIPVADPGEGPGPLFLNQGLKKFFETGPPFRSQGLDDQSPLPSPPLPEGLDLLLNSVTATFMLRAGEALIEPTW